MKNRLFLFLSILSFYSQASIHQGERNYQSWTSSYTRATNGCPSFCDSITRYSQVYGVPEKLVISVIHHESNFNPNAVSPKGAKGLMQLMDINSQAAQINPFDPDENIHTGTKLLSRLIRKYDNVELALAAYNAGEGNVDKYQGIPPFKETQRYIRDVMRTFELTN
ncbi:lytic transglycosylase domain-containing protein [Vibrio vulnificus]|uniref:lytic transglycosylase domain-containing protein n=1 Tax=Vibrio vulnificus TaxID=672 RepID=UPI001A27D1EF|nr:transglycosylase SLT domain-containing protein [Vibrio vulnificus]MCA3966851.1 lytic transglycosylase domain-containing protein [Vibrio vulnificus]HAS6111688.1 transglycosylase SLT domain-containing protein [Vibrio vulnificus]